MQEVKTKETDKLAAQKHSNMYFMCACIQMHAPVCVYVCAVHMHVCAYVCAVCDHAVCGHVYTVCACKCICIVLCVHVCICMWMCVLCALYVHVYMYSRCVPVYVSVFR